MSEPASAQVRSVNRLIGVYDADHTLRGEVAYWIGARLGRRHCSLCDITHGAVREKGAWKECREGLPVPFDTHHRDDQPAEVRAAVPTAPVVVAITDDGVVPLLGPADLERCDGSVDRLVEAIEQAVERLGLTFAAS